MKSAVHLALLTVVMALALKSEEPIAFEAASVKPAVPVGKFNPPYRRATPVRVEYRNYPLARLIAEAYGVADYQVQAAAWVGRERYEITAIKPLHTSAADTRLMMQALLVERFHLATHQATKEMDVYYLLPGNVALLRPEHDEHDVPGCKSFGTLGEFADMVSRHLNAPVVDKTNIPGTFYFILSWSTTLTAHELTGESAPPPPPASAPPPCPGWSAATMPPLASDIFEAARKQMGLRLERHGRAPVEVLVVDRAERSPESN